LSIVGHHEEILEIVESEMSPTVGKVWRRAECKYKLEVFIVLLVRLVRFSQEAEPYSPLVEKQLFL